MDKQRTKKILRKLIFQKNNILKKLTILKENMMKTKKVIERKVKDEVQIVQNCNICMFPIKKCICQPFWKNFHSYFNETSLQISTITFGFKLKDTTINLGMLALKFEKSIFARNIKFKKNSKKSQKNLDMNYNFYNQCSITSFIPHEKFKNQLVKVDIKIFHNGSFNIAGSRSIQGIVHVIRKLMSLLVSYKNVLNYKKELKIIDVKISMINTDFKINKKIRQKTLNTILNDKRFSLEQGGSVKWSEFDPDKYHGVKIKYVHEHKHQENTHLTRKGIEKLPGELSILVFNTGHVIITGGKTAKETVEAYKFINKIFEDFSNDVIRDLDVVKKKKKKKIYFKRIELDNLNKELKEEREKEEKKHFYSLKQRVLNDMMVKEHKKHYKNVLLEISNIRRNRCESFTTSSN